jgi:hypothetical protein
MMSREAIYVLSVAELAADYGVPDLADYLARADVPLIRNEDNLVVPETEWRRAVAEAIRRAYADQPLDGDGAAAAWGGRRQRMLERNPDLADLAEQFISYVEQHEQGVVVKRNKGTVTFIMPGKRWAGMKPRATYGLQLYATRNDRRLDCSARSAGEFERALNWLRALPKYQHTR